MSDQEPEVIEQTPPESSINLDNLPKPEHNWVKRGVVVSCEGANHPNHRHFLVKK